MIARYGERAGFIELISATLFEASPDVLMTKKVLVIQYFNLGANCVGTSAYILKQQSNGFKRSYFSLDICMKLKSTHMVLWAKLQFLCKYIIYMDTTLN